MRYYCFANCFIIDGSYFINKSLLLIAYLCFLCPSFCFACFCSSKDSIPEAINNSDVVFYGKVLSKEFWQVDSRSAHNRYVRYKFKVSIFYKVKFRYAYDTIELLSGVYMYDNCSYSFEVGNRYIVYANWHSRGFGFGEKRERKLLYTDACTRTTLGNHHKNGELLKVESYLRSKYKKRKIRCVKYVWLISLLLTLSRIRIPPW